MSFTQTEYENAVSLVLQEQRAAASLLRQKLLFSQSKIQRLLKQMEKDGIVSPEKSGARQVLRAAPIVEKKPEVIGVMSKTL